jgi:hypothetical protein
MGQSQFKKSQFHFCDIQCRSGVGREEITCKSCGKKKSIIKSNNASFCSRVCAKKGRCGTGSGWIDRQGYRHISVDGKPMLEHRYVMGTLLGRKLFRGETVHHGPDGRADNRPQNLELRAPGKHKQGWSIVEMKKYLQTIPRKLGGLK